jgi:hypothetical protein
LKTKYLVAIILTIGGFSTARANQVAYLTWEEVPTARGYQLLLSTTRRFKKGTTEIINLTSPKGELAINDKYQRGKRYAKIRAVFGKRNVGAWFPIRFVKFRRVELPETVEVPFRLQGKYRLKWPTPKGRLSSENHLYRIRLERFEDQQMIYDVIDESQSFTLPRLPGGNYAFTVEALGVPEIGTLALESDTIGGTTVQVDPIPYDPKNPDELPKSMVITSSDFFPSFQLNLENQSLFLTSAGYQNALITNIRAAFDFDISVSLSLPMILAGNGGVRLGGGPDFPSANLGFRLWGDDRRYFSTGVGAILPIDSRDENIVDSEFPTILTFNAAGRWSIQRFVLDATMVYGLSLKKGLPNDFSTALAPAFITQASVGYALLDEKLLPSLVLGYLLLGEIDVIGPSGQIFSGQGNINSFTVAAKVEYLLLRQLSFNALLEFNIANTPLNSRFGVGATLIF